MWRCCFPKPLHSADAGAGTHAFEAATDAEPEAEPDPSPGTEGWRPADGAGRPSRHERPRSLQEAPEGEAPDRPGASRVKVPLLRALSQPSAPTAEALQRRSRRGTLDGSRTLSLRSEGSNGPDSVFSSGSDSGLGGGPVPAVSLTGHLDMSGMRRRDFMALSQDQMRAMGRDCKRLTLPRGCTAEAVRAWLRACPDIEEITALDIVEDGRPLSAVQAQQLRYFRTFPPGPSTLYLGLKARAVVPQDLAPHQDPDPGLTLDRLRGWAQTPETLPPLSDAEFVAIRDVVERHVLESVQRYRDGFWVTPRFQSWAPALMQAVPAELLSGVDAANHAHVLKRLSDRRNIRLSYAELVNFVRPMLKACWDVVARQNDSFRYQRRAPDELAALAALQLWVLSASPQEIAGQRERVAAFARRSEQWGDERWRRQLIDAALKGHTPVLDGDQVVSQRP